MKIMESEVWIVLSVCHIDGEDDVVYRVFREYKDARKDFDQSVHDELNSDWIKENQNLCISPIQIHIDGRCYWSAYGSGDSAEHILERAVIR